MIIKYTGSCFISSMLPHITYLQYYHQFNYYLYSYYFIYHVCVRVLYRPETIRSHFSEKSTFFSVRSRARGGVAHPCPPMAHYTWPGELGEDQYKQQADHYFSIILLCGGPLCAIWQYINININYTIVNVLIYVNMSKTNMNFTISS